MSIKQVKSLKINKISDNTIIFSFFDEFIADTTNIMIFIGKKNIFVCDTFLGPDSITEIQQYLKENYSNSLKNKKVVVFNSHSDWDHIWGNCSEWFTNSLIISHYNSYFLQKNEAVSKLEELSKHSRGKVKIKLPNLLFDTKIEFPEDNISFFHTPGHTKGSASCYIENKDILFVGDNLEEPLPYIYYYNEGFTDYISTLKKYLSLNPKIVIPGHGKISNLNLIQDNLKYIRNMASRQVQVEKLENKQQGNHLSNLNSLYKYNIQMNNKIEALRFLEMLHKDFENATIDIANREDQIKIINDRIKSLQ